MMKIFKSDWHLYYDGKYLETYLETNCHWIGSVKQRSSYMPSIRLLRAQLCLYQFINKEMTFMNIKKLYTRLLSKNYRIQNMTTSVRKSRLFLKLMETVILTYDNNKKAAEYDKKKEKELQFKILIK